ncbi:MAG: DUF4400 domain-containing protein [Pseudomonadota bacterium]|nr:DUF4400 domain-containing protein [Pseudomonadota bacterium]
MAEAPSDPRRAPVQQRTISKSLTATAKIIQWLMLSLLFSIVIEWIGMVLWWPDEDLDHSRTMLATEVIYLESDFRCSVVTSDPERFARKIADKSSHYLFEVTGAVLGAPGAPHPGDARVPAVPPGGPGRGYNVRRRCISYSSAPIVTV